jgi:2-polyprenyl-3-methyl-5-hydroxy-6-metoxy-1,4-benzoquinol methylase
VPVINSPLEQAQIVDETYDAITLNHVLEHLHYPLTSLGHLNRLLKMGGFLIVEVPDIETTQHSPVNRFHYAHVYNFNHDTLRAMLEKSGFAVQPHADLNSTTLIAKKVGAPDVARMVAMPENYQRLRHLMSFEVASENYRKKKPLKRLLNKAKRYSLEYIEASLIRDPKKIVGREFRKWEAQANSK